MDLLKKFSRKERTSLQQLRVFTFMLTQAEIGKSINVKATDPQSAENSLRENYSGWDVKYLWEWK